MVVELRINVFGASAAEAFVAQFQQHGVNYAEFIAEEHLLDDLVVDVNALAGNHHAVAVSSYAAGHAQLKPRDIPPLKSANGFLGRHHSSLILP